MSATGAWEDQLVESVELITNKLCEAEEALDELLEYVYRKHPRGADLKRTTTDELERRHTSLGSVFDVMPVVRARRLLEASGYDQDETTNDRPLTAVNADCTCRYVHRSDPLCPSTAPSYGSIADAPARNESRRDGGSA